MNVFLYVFAKLYYIWRNKVRDREWAAMSREVSMLCSKSVG